MRPYYLLPLFLLQSPLSTDDSVEINGTVGTTRLVMLSQNTISNEANFSTGTGGSEYELGSVEINIFDNTGVGGGTVYMDNMEYIEDTFRLVLPSDSMEQARVEIYSSLDSSGAPLDDTINPVAITTTTGDVEDETFTLTYSVVDDPENSTKTGQFIGNFQFYWTD
ncbi:hypothetical protein K0U07_05480 [bacterium]|nr:hypothetical protein [bacterium]